MLSIFKETEHPISHINFNELIHEANSFFSEKVIALDEQLTGDLFSAEKIVIDHTGKLTGTIIAPVCVVSGTIEGNIISTGQTEIKSTAKINGNIRTSLINIETGAVINGSIIMDSDMEAFTNLSQKITDHAGRDFLSYNLALETLNHKDDYQQEVIQPKPAPAANVVEEKTVRVENTYAAQPVIPVEIISAKTPEPVAAAPIPEPVKEAPIPVQKPAVEKPQENNTRWW